MGIPFNNKRRISPPRSGDKIDGCAGLNNFRLTAPRGTGSRETGNNKKENTYETKRTKDKKETTKHEMKGCRRQPLPANIKSEIEKHEIKRKM